MVAFFALNLRLLVDSLSQYLQFHQDNFGKKFANNIEDRDAAVIVTVVPVTLVPVESDYVGIPHVLWDLTFYSALAKYLT